MNNITVKVELCDEDRARLDKAIELLGRFVSPVVTGLSVPGVEVVEDTELRKKLEQVVASVKPTSAEAAETPQDAPSASEHPTLDPFPEAPTGKADASEESAKEVTAAEFQQLAIALCRQKKQADIKKVLDEYGVQTVSEVLSKVPEDKRHEVYEKLKALEG